jgi:hypothetical protein
MASPPQIVIPTEAERSEAKWRDLSLLVVDQEGSLDYAARRAATLGMTAIGKRIGSLSHKNMFDMLSISL